MTPRRKALVGGLVGVVMLVLATTANAVAPTVSITSPTPGNSTSGSIAFSVSDPDANSTVTCTLDGSSTSPCGSPYSYSGIGHGSHTFTVVADNAEGSSSDSETWSIDIVGPSISIGSTPANPTRSTSAAFTFSANESTNFQCRLDGSAFADCSSGQSYSGLSIGPHTFRVTGTDSFGNAGNTASYTWTIEPPDTSITSTPPNPSGPSASFSFSSAESGSFECQLDGGGFEGCGSPKAYTGLASGSHTFSVRAKDALGNTDPTPASATWTVDATPPDTSITGAPSGAVASRTASVGFSASEPATFECKLDGASFTSCSSPVSLSGLADGTHTFSVRATDTLGNAEGSPATATWSVDATPPVISVVSPSPPRYEAQSPKGATGVFVVTATDTGNVPAGVTCSPSSGSTFPLGTSRVECSTKDALGNSRMTRFDLTVVDSTPPRINAPNVTVAATTDSGIGKGEGMLATYFQGITATDSVSRATLTNNAPRRFPIGKTTFTVTAVDVAGNKSTKTVEVTVLEVGEAAPPLDLAPPRPVAKAKAAPGSGQVVVTWKNPAKDFGTVQLRVLRIGKTGVGRVIYRGVKHTFTAKGLKNGSLYRFTLIVADEAGNLSTPVTVTGKPYEPTLFLPKLNAALFTPPLLKWKQRTDASYFNVQLYHGKIKVLSIWPISAKLQLPKTWTYLGKKYTLTPGVYTWYVWPGIGPRADVKYGQLLGSSTFKVMKPKATKPTRQVASSGPRHTPR